MKPNVFFGLSQHTLCAVVIMVACATGCATSSGITMVDPEGRPTPITPEEIDAISGEETPYLLQVGDQFALTFRVRNLRADDMAWDYRIEVGDSMEVRFSPEVRDSDRYRMDVGDVVGVSFLNNWPLNAIRTIRPDGKITLAEIGDVTAAGLTTTELRDRLNPLYERTGIIQGDPKISVNVDFVNVDRLESMSRDVTVRPDGAIRVPGFKDSVSVAGLTLSEASAAIRREAARVLQNEPVVTLVVFPATNTTLNTMDSVATVGPDGKVAVPRLGDIQAAGYSMDELRENLAKACADLAYNRVDVSVNPIQLTGSRVYVGGEVGRSGVYPLAGSPTALQAIVLAMGPRNAARMNNVLVVRRNPEGKPFVFKTNLRKALYDGYTENDITLRPFDVVYVPRRAVSRANRFVEEYIDNMVPFNNNLGVQATYYLNEQNVNTKNRNLNYGFTAVPAITGP